MKEKEYDIEVKEVLTRVVSVEAMNIDEAIDNVVDMYDREEIVLDYENCSERIFNNLYSKPLKEDFNININFKNGNLTIQNDDNKKETYSCLTVRHIGSCLNMFINEYMEKHDIESHDGHQIENELDIDEIER